MSNFIRREADSLYFRRRVPAPLQPRLGLESIRQRCTGFSGAQFLGKGRFWEVPPFSRTDAAPESVPKMAGPELNEEETTEAVSAARK